MDFVNPYLTALTTQLRRWQQAIAALEDATRRYDQGAAMAALDVGHDAARQVNALTLGSPDRATESRWIAAIEGWNNAGFGFSGNGNRPLPFWMWIIIGVAGLAVIRRK